MIDLAPYSLRDLDRSGISPRELAVIFDAHLKVRCTEYLLMVDTTHKQEKSIDSPPSVIEVYRMLELEEYPLMVHVKAITDPRCLSRLNNEYGRQYTANITRDTREITSLEVRLQEAKEIDELRK